MNPIETLYSATENPMREAWKKFLFLDPSLQFLRRNTTKTAVRHGDRSFPLNSFRFTLFPDESNEGVNERFQQAANRGIQAINQLCREYLKPEDLDLFRIPELLPPFDLSDAVHTAFKEREESFTGRSDPDPQKTLHAYNIMRALELGYRVGMIDACPYVLSSVRSFDEVKKRLAGLLGFQDKKPVELNGLMFEWDTQAGSSVYSYDDYPFHARLKYLDESGSDKPKYSSILMKMFLQLEYPEEITDYIGAEFIVKDDDARDNLIGYFRKETRPLGIFERFRDATRKSLGEASSHQYGVKKFVLRVPVKHSEKYERVPVEVQILTQWDHQARMDTEASHYEYKRRQFLRVFPILFPRQIYEPLVREHS